MSEIDETRQQDETTGRWCLKQVVFYATIILLMIALPALFMWSPKLPDDGSGVGPILTLPLVILMTVGGLALVLYVTRWTMRGTRQRFDRSGVVFQRTLPDLEIEQHSKAGDQVFSGKLFVRLTFLTPFLCLLAGALGWATREGLGAIWPDAPKWVETVAVWGVLLGVGQVIRKFVNKRREHRGEPTIAFKESIRNIVRNLLFFFLIMPPLLWLIKTIGDLDVGPLWIGPLGLVAVILASTLLFAVYTLIPYLWVIAATKKGNYDQAIRRVRVAQTISLMRSQYLGLHGHILFLAGRYKEAEQMLRTGIVESRKEAVPGDSDALNIMGYALLGQDRYDEGVEAFKGSIAIKPSQGTAYDSLAEAYLSRGIETERALELLDRALSSHQSSWISRRLSQSSIRDTQAGRAWALAELGRRDEAAEALEKAFVGDARKNVTHFASILYRAGQAMIRLGEMKKAFEYFEEGDRLDPKGHFGRLCAKAAERLRER